MSLEDEVAIRKLNDFRKEILTHNTGEPQTEIKVKDDFDERFVKGLSMEESRRRTAEFIESLSWKK